MTATTRSEPRRLHNLFACLVHESEECVVDLVRNLRFCDPDSEILLYNGGDDDGLLARAPALERLGAVVYPRPRKLSWGALHEFALDAMRFALGRLPFDTLTIVDSDQLALRQGYSRALAEHLAGDSGVGLLGSADGIPARTTQLGPVRAAYREIELWRPLLRRFAGGEEKFAHWTFWPATVFTAAAAAELVDFYDRDDQLREIIAESRIWATEEVILPTLVALLGFRVERSPLSYRTVRYRVRYSRRQLERALGRDDAFWIHPVSRRYGDPLRRSIRRRLDHYHRAPPRDDRAEPGGLLLTQPILSRIRGIEGWLEDDEADLLIAACAQALRELPAPQSLVEIGSYLGRSTVALGSVVQALGSKATVYAIDPHDGQVGALDPGLTATPPTRERLERNLVAHGLSERVEVIPKLSFQVAWRRPIGLLLVDGLHDYPNVSRDFLHFEPWIADGGYIAFHDYSDYWPEVRVFVDELLASGRYRQVALARSLIVLRKPAGRRPPADRGADRPPAVEIVPPSRALPGGGTPPGGAAAGSQPLVSCIMPTRDRRRFVPLSLRCFLDQDYPNLELLVADDGDQPIADLLPPPPRVRYLRVERGTTLGEKRNLACATAAGEILMHFDDDDWSAPWRVSYQVRSLLEQGAGLNGLDRVLFYDLDADRAWWYVYRRRRTRWLCGGSLCYRRELWQSSPFPPLDNGEDSRFVARLRSAGPMALPRQDFYVATIHPHNTSPRRTGRRRRFSPCPTERVHRLLGDLQLAAWRAPGSIHRNVR